jgi:hypothetical protein
MKYLLLFCVLLSMFSCKTNQPNYIVVIVENENINSSFLQRIETP